MNQSNSSRTQRPRGTGCVYRQPGSTVWWIKYSRSGKSYRESAHTTERKKAEKFLARRLAEIQTGNFYGPRVERVKVDELAEDFLRDYKINQRKSLDDAEARWELHLSPSFAHFRAIDVGSELLARYVDLRQSEGAKNATINRELACLKRMYSLGLHSTPPKVYRVPRFPKLVERNVRTGFVEDEQYERLATASGKIGLWMRALFECGYVYGWRVSELQTLQVKQVHLPSRTIRLEVGTTKNDEGREVLMTEKVYQLLRQCVEGKAEKDYVFTREGLKKPIRDFRASWEKVCNEAGVGKLLFHDLRRTAARNLRRAGVAEGVIMKIGGWKTRSVFERYAVVAQSDVADAMQKLEAQTAEQRARKSHDETEFGHSSVIVQGDGAPLAKKSKVN